MVIWAQVAIGALKVNYEMTDDEIGSLELGDDAVCMVGICAAACGRTAGLLKDQRHRALTVAALGMCDVPLTPNEIAGLSDFAVNSGRAPGIG